MIKQLDEIDHALYAIKVGLLISDFKGAQLGIGRALNFLDSLRREVELRKDLTEYKKGDKDYEEAEQQRREGLLEG